MKRWYWRLRFWSLTLAAGSLFAVEGCGLSDRQLATIWQSVLQTGLNTVVSNLVTTAFAGVQATG